MTAPANACACSECKSACGSRPGYFKPDEIALLAAAMGLTPKTLFDGHLSVDWWEGSDHFILMPATKGGNPGDMNDYDPRGACTFLTEDGRCDIHELGKPFECAAMLHSEPERVSVNHKRAAKAWNNPEAQTLIRTLLGKEPVIPESDRSSFGFFGMFG